MNNTNRHLDRFFRFVAWRVLPRRLVMWAAYRVLATATSGPYGNEHPDSVGALEALRRWDRA